MKNKPVIIGAIIVVIVILFIGITLFNKSKQKAVVEPTPTMTEEVIPTIDQSVVVTLTKSTYGKEVILSISKIPNQTESIDYELSYQTLKQGLQGVIGTIKLTSETEYEKKITLGTCSSGTCIYHDVTGLIKLNLKFNGQYGERIYEKEFSI